jgi:hypothetical protein
MFDLIVGKPTETKCKRRFWLDQLKCGTVKLYGSIGDEDIVRTILTISSSGTMTINRDLIKELDFEVRGMGI